MSNKQRKLKIIKECQIRDLKEICIRTMFFKEINKFNQKKTILLIYQNHQKTGPKTPFSTPREKHQKRG